MNILLMGAGWIADIVYLPFLEELDTVNVIYIHDVNTNKKYNDSNKIQRISYHEISQIKIEIVFILTPNFMHHDNLIHFLEKSTCIIIEKPICINRDELNSIIEKIEGSSNEHAVCVSTPFRYRKDIKKIKSIIDSGRLGAIYHVEMTWMKKKVYLAQIGLLKRMSQEAVC